MKFKKKNIYVDCSKHVLKFTGLRGTNQIVVLVILLIGIARFEKGKTCKQQFKTVDLYWAEPVGSIGPTGWFPVSTVARFTSIPNSLESVPPKRKEKKKKQKKEEKRKLDVKR